MAEKKLKAIIETTYNGKGADQAEKDMEQLAKQGQKTGQQLGGAGGAVGKLSNNLVGMAKSLAAPMLGFLALDRAVTGTVSFLRSSINDWVAYNEEIRKLGAATGSSVEDLSRLLQAADDVGVEMGSMMMAMRLASQNGITPTIENMAKLSDKLLLITDDAKRAEEMQKIFGRGWAEVAGFMLKGSDAIIEMTGSINDNLVVTQESAQQAREYSKALDDLNDTIQGMKNAIAQAALPGLTDMSEAIAEAANNLQDMDRQAKIATFGWKEFLKYMQGGDVDQIYTDMMQNRAAVEAFNQAVEQGTLTQEEAWQMQKQVQLENANLTDQLMEYGIVADVTADKETALTMAYERSIPAMQYYAVQAETAKNATKKLADAAQNAGRKIEWMFDKLDTDISGDIAKSLDQIAYKLNFGDVVNNAYTEAKKKIQEGKVTPQEGQEILSGLFVAAEALKVKGGEIDFKEAAQNISENLDMPLKEAVDWLQFLISKDGAKFNYTALLNILYSSSGRQYDPYRSGASSSTTENSGSGPRGAKGLDMVVPSGYPNDSYPLWAQSGERVTITPAGEKSSAGGMVVTIGDINVYEAQSPRATAEAVIAIINKRMAGSRLAGARYTGA